MVAGVLIGTDLLALTFHDRADVVFNQRRYSLSLGLEDDAHVVGRTHGLMGGKGV